MLYVDKTAKERFSVHYNSSLSAYRSSAHLSSCFLEIMLEFKCNFYRLLP